MLFAMFLPALIFFCSLSGGIGNLGSGLAEVDGLSSRHASGFGCRVDSDVTKAEVDVEVETETKVDVKVESETEADIKVKARPEVKVERETEADVKVKARPEVKVEVEAEVDVKVKASLEVKADTETEMKKWAKVGEEAKVTMKWRPHGGTDTRMEVDEKMVSEVGIETKSEAEVVSVLKVRGTPLKDDVERTNNSGLSTLGGEDWAVETLRPFLEWMRTRCRHLLMDVELMINFRQTSGQGQAQGGSSRPKLNSKMPHPNGGTGYRSWWSNWDGRTFKRGFSHNDPVTRIRIPSSKYLDEGEIEGRESSRFMEAKKRTPKSPVKQPQNIPQEKETGIIDGDEDEAEQQRVNIPNSHRRKWHNDFAYSESRPGLIG